MGQNVLEAHQGGEVAQPKISVSEVSLHSSTTSDQHPPLNILDKEMVHSSIRNQTQRRVRKSGSNSFSAWKHIACRETFSFDD
jgi:hypothetical protein